MLNTKQKSIMKQVNKNFRELSKNTNDYETIKNHFDNTYTRISNLEAPNEYSNKYDLKEIANSDYKDGCHIKTKLGRTDLTFWFYKTAPQEIIIALNHYSKMENEKLLLQDKLELYIINGGK